MNHQDNPSYERILKLPKTVKTYAPLLGLLFLYLFVLSLWIFPILFFGFLSEILLLIPLSLLLIILPTWKYGFVEYEYVFSGMPPQCMGDTIKAELVLGGSILAVKDGYSILQYCKNILSSSASKLGMTEEKYNSMRVLIADLLEYGAKAQVYMNYKTDALVNEGITGASRVDRIEEDGKVVKPTRLEGVELRAFGVHFDSACSLFVKLTAPEMKPGELRLNFSDTTYYLLSSCELLDASTSTYYLKLDRLSVLDYDTVFDIDIEIYDADSGEWVIIQTSRYSVNSYAYSMQSSENSAMVELALSLYKYGVSAAEVNK